MGKEAIVRVALVYLRDIKSILLNLATSETKAEDLDIAIASVNKAIELVGSFL